MPIIDDFLKMPWEVPSSPPSDTRRGGGGTFVQPTPEQMSAEDTYGGRDYSRQAGVPETSSSNETNKAAAAAAKAASAASGVASQSARDSSNEGVAIGALLQPEFGTYDPYGPGYQPASIIPSPKAMGTRLPELGLGLASAKNWTSLIRKPDEYKGVEYAPQIEIKEGAYTPDQKLGTFISIAQSYIGQNRYSYGGFDCSKYVQEVASKYGIKVPRDTRSQMSWFRSKGMWTEGSLAGIKPGDVIYFKSGSSPSGRHVGIYLGNGYMVDNSGAGKPIQKRPIAGREVLGYGRLPSPTGDPKGDGYGLNTYGLKNTGDAKDKGTAPYGLAEPMWRALRRAQDEMVAQGLGRFGITSGFRDKRAQAALKAKQPEQTAPPGKSLHGAGIAADLKLTRQQEQWLAQNAYRLGLVVPSAAEPWHVQIAPRAWKGN